MSRYFNTLLQLLSRIHVQYSLLGESHLKNDFSSWRELKQQWHQTLDATFVESYKGGFLNHCFSNYEEAKAHPRFEAKTNLLHTYSYSNLAQELRYYCFESQGNKVDSRTIGWPYACMMHDFIITENYCLFPCFPVTYDFQRVVQTGEFFKWEPEKSSYFGIMSRHDKNVKVIWVEFDPCFVFYFANAFELNGEVIIDGFKYKESPLFNSEGKPMSTELVRWKIDLKQPSVSEDKFYTCRGEFPSFDERFNGYAYQYCYFDEGAHGHDDLNQTSTLDFATGEVSYHRFGETDNFMEPVFVPRAHSSTEGDGYLLTLCYQRVKDRSELVVLDAKQVVAEPIAIVKLPYRLPNGFHENWMNNMPHNP